MKFGTDIDRKYTYTLRTKYCLLVRSNKHGDDAQVWALFDRFNISKNVFSNKCFKKLNQIMIIIIIIIIRRQSICWTLNMLANRLYGFCSYLPVNVIRIIFLKVMSNIVNPVSESYYSFVCQHQCKVPLMLSCYPGSVYLPRVWSIINVYVKKILRKPLESVKIGLKHLPPVWTGNSYWNMCTVKDIHARRSFVHA
jgi:hypothetical protein